MSANVSFQLGNFPLGYCWTNPQTYGADLIALLTGTVNATGKVIVSGTAPGPADQDAVWIRTVSGYIEGIYLYLGGWYRPNPRPPNSPERIIWRDTEANLWSYEGGDGTDPIGSPPTATTGAMWQRDTDFGKDDGSVPFRVPVGVGKNSVAYDGGAATTITLGAAGGEERHQLVAAETPSLTGFNPPVTGVWAREAGSGTTNLQSAAGNNDGLVLPTLGGDKSHQNMPTYLGVFFAKRTSRQYIVAT